MKKIYLFAAAAALLTACSSEELSNQEVAQQSAETPVAFSIYTPRSVTRAGLPGVLTTAIVADPKNDSEGKATNGFGVFGYYSNGQKYAEANTYPNFMYNQLVFGNGKTGTDLKWNYEPVKYWPNEYGKAATSDDVDRVTFFAYAPWTKVDPSTGVMADAAEDEKDIVGMTRNNAIGDPIIKYVVDTDPATSVDLLWGVAAPATDETSSDPKEKYSLYTEWGSAKAMVNGGAPFIDLLKPNDPLAATTTGDNKIRFNLRHALAKLNVQIDYIADDPTPKPKDPTTDEGKFDPNYDEPAPASEVITASETKIFIREIKIGGFSMKGALNLNNGENPKKYTKTGMTNPDPVHVVPNWKAFDGVNDLVYEMVTFKDGRRDGKEGAVDATADGESFLGLNPCLLQTAPYEVNDADYPTAFTNTNLKGVLNTPVNLFANWDKTAKAYTENTDLTKPIFVIPNDKEIDIEIVYDVETVNPKVASKLSDGIVPGVVTENKIKKTSKEIFNTKAAVTMQAGEGYTIKIHLGMTSVKVEAVVEPWDDSTAAGIAELPANQPKP